MDDLFVEVHKRRNERFRQQDNVRLGRRGSGTLAGMRLKQIFSGLKVIDDRSSSKPVKNAGLNQEVLTPTVKQNQGNLPVDRPYASSTDVQSCLHPLESDALTSTTPLCQKVFQPEDMKKVPTDPRIVGKHKMPSSNTHWYVPNEFLGLPPVPNNSSSNLHHITTTDAPLSALDLDNTVSDVSDGSNAPNQTPGEWTIGGAGDTSADFQADEADGHHVQMVINQQKKKEAIEHYKKKIERLMRAIKAEQQAKQENVNEYLQLSAAANIEKIQLLRIKAIFEKKNQKSTHLIGQLQRKMENSVKRLKEVETHAAGMSSRQGKGMLKDVGHGIKTIVSKPKEFAHLLRNKFGSADNISGLGECMENDQHSEESHPVRRGSITLPSHFKYHSTDDVMNLDTQTNDTALFHSEAAGQQVAPVSPPTSDHFSVALKQLERSKLNHSQLQDCINDLQTRIEDNHNRFKQSLEEERVRREHLEEQVNDLMELHQNEVTNLKQELSGIEEKMEYQLEERTRDMQDLLESCQTKITKMDLQQQQQQQLISMESFDNSTVRTLVTKLINVVLALLAVLLVLINTATSLLEPFINTRVRCVATLVGVAAVAILWHNSHLISSVSGVTHGWFRSFVNQ